MRNYLRTISIAVICAGTMSAAAATEDLSATAYSVVTKPGERMTVAGKTVLVGMETHAHIVNDRNGETTSQWCTGDAWLDTNGNQTHAVAHCTAVYDSGDMVHVGIVQGAGDGAISWTVFGGTGKYAGATGGGRTTLVSARADGFAITFKIQGKIETP